MGTTTRLKTSPKMHLGAPARLLLVCCATLALAACGPDGDDDDTPMIDAGGGADAAESDAAPDASTADAGPDAGTDAGLDAGPPDHDIHDIQNGTIAVDTAVRVAGVVVTARKDTASSTVLFVQELTGTPEFSGLFVFVDTNPTPAFGLPAVGDVITVEGTVAEFARDGLPGSRTNLDPVTNIVVTGTAAMPAPVVVAEADLIFGATAAESWEGVLVRVQPATVAATEAGGIFTLAGGLKVDDRLFTYASPLVGDSYTSIVGPVDHDFGTTRLLPRAETDLVGLVAAAPVLVSLTPPASTVAEAGTATLTVTLDRVAPAGGTTIQLGSDLPAVAAPDATSVVVAAGQTSATFDVDGLTEGTAVISAMLGGVTLTASVEVSSVPPQVTALAPASLDVLAAGGTGLLTVTLDRAAPVGGQSVTITSTDVGVAIPATVLVPAGATTATLRVRGDAVATASSTVTVSAGGGSAMATVNVVLTAPAPVVGDVVINEINYDVGAANADANCDGAIDATKDEFVELVNVSAHPIELLGVGVWDATATPRLVFPAFVLGSGEALLVYGGIAFGTAGTAPWCTGVTATSIAGVRVFTTSASGLGLTNGGDTVHVTLTNVAGTDLTPAETVPAGSDESWVRSPDVTGTFGKHNAAAGHLTDRSFTPGTRLDGRPFADASAPPPAP